MKYMGIPAGMWLLFVRSFARQLTDTFGYERSVASVIQKRALKRYQRLIETLPEFERGDRFKMNIVNCAMLSAFVLEMPDRPEVNKLTDYYAQAMMTPVMKAFLRYKAKDKFTAKDYEDMKQTALLRAGDRNPYSWNMDFLPYPDGNGYEARFTKCGICTLMKELGLYDLVPAMCHLDYTMNEAGGVSDFVREYTLASGGPYCDCGYRKRKEKP